MGSGLPRLVLGGCLGAGLALAAGACGSRTGLLVDTSEPAPPSAEFCALQDYSAGGADLAIYIMLDRSLSMEDNDKWQQATAAIDAFAHAPDMAGVSVGLNYFPSGWDCSIKTYSVPAVPVALLPGNADAIAASLAAQSPWGETPTLPALEGAIQYARALMLAEPSRKAVIALVTDGAPNDCDSTPSSVAAVAHDGASGTPQVLTFAIGLRVGFVGDLDIVAANGGTGKPILVSNGPKAGQELVDALRELRDAETSCHFAVPPVPGVTVRGDDVRVGYRPDTSTSLASVPRVADASGCAATPNAYYLDDDSKPSAVELCPALCAAVHAQASSHVTVASGCGGSFDAGPPTTLPDAGNCGGLVSFNCVTKCGSTDYVDPICVSGFWTCPPGSVSLKQCADCPPVPHACCLAGAQLTDASCIDGAWICPPGGTMYGQPGCTAPAVCAAALPCASGQYCVSPDFACGTGGFAGHCVPVPSACDPSGPPVCGCDSKTYSNACQASQQAVDLSATASCPVIANHFACGPLFCNTASEVCRKTPGSAAGLFDYACLALPPGCVTGCNCSLCPPCPAGKLCKDVCSQDPASGGRLLTCAEL